MAGSAYQVKLGREAVRQLRKLAKADQVRVRDALITQAAAVTVGDGSRGGKSLKRIRHPRERIFRLRVGELRVVFDLLAEERTLLVLGILNRRDLERWLRGR